MAIVCAGVDLAKNVFAIHGVDDVGEAVWVQAQVPRARLLVAFSHIPWRFIGLATCSGALLRARHATA
jgi:transposase